MNIKRISGPITQIIINIIVVIVFLTDNFAGFNFKVLCIILISLNIFSLYREYKRKK